MTTPRTDADVAATRAAYDAVAADYADLLRGELARMPHDRAVLGLFADLVRATGGRRVADLGCGPGRLTAHLHALGLSALGIDLSPGMVAVARADHPHLRFEVGNLEALDLPDAGLHGVVSWYSLIHTPPDRRPAAVDELARVLAPGGEAVLAFQVGDEVIRHRAAYGHPVTLDSYRLPVDEVTDLLGAAGLEVHTSLVRSPEGSHERTPQAYLLARRPPRPRSAG